MAVNKIGGVSTVGGGIYEELVVHGVVTVNGDLEAQSMDVDGVVTVDGKLESKSFIKINGVVTVNGNLRAQFVDVDGVVNIASNVEADHVRIGGVVSSKAQISADLVEGNGVISAEEIVGEKVILHCEHKRRHLFSLGRKDRDKPRVGTIEATEIDVDGIRVENLNGHNIVIGPQCVVENVDCSGTLSIAPEAQVKNINGSARMN